MNRRYRFIALVLLSLFSPTTLSLPSEPLFPDTGPSLEYEIAEGHLTLLFQNITVADIESITLGDDPVDIGQSETFRIEYTDNGFTISFEDAADLGKAGIVNVTLRDGRVLQRYILSGPISSLAWLSEATCATAPGMYNAIRCDSVTSTVGTPPYPCCDNDRDGKATSSIDGNCTWYAWYRAKRDRGWNVPGAWGSATKWCSNAARTPGWKVISTPTANTIACSASIGHVGWVRSVSSDRKLIYLDEQNCKTPPFCKATGVQTNQRYKADSFQYIVKNDGYASVSNGVSVSPSPVTLDKNFTITFALKERRGATKIFERVAVAILKSSGSFVFDFAMYTNVTIPANGTWSRSATNVLFSRHGAGTYKAVVRGKTPGGNWFDFDTVGGGVNPRVFGAVGGSPAGTIKITDPSPGETWRTDTAHSINWETTNLSGSDHLRIEYSLNDGATWNNIDSSASNDGEKDWDPGEKRYGVCHDTNTARIRITHVDNPSVSVTSERFTLDHKKGHPDC